MDRGRPLLSNGGGVRFELVCGEAFRRKAMFIQQLSQQSLRRSSAASGLDREVERLAFVVDRPPQPVLPATDLDDHFVEMPASTGTRTAAMKITGDQPPKFQEPAPDGLV